MSSIKNNASVCLVITTLTGEIYGMFEVGNALLAKLLNIHNQFKDFPILRKEANFIGQVKQEVYEIQDIEYLKSLVGSMILLSHRQQVELLQRLEKDEGLQFSLVVRA